MKLKYLTLLAMLAAGTTAAQAPPTTEPGFDIRSLRPAAVPLIARPLDIDQSSDPIWVRGDQPTANLIATLQLRPVAAVTVEHDFGQGTGRPLVLWMAVTGPADTLVLSRNLATLGDGRERLYCADGVGGAYAGKILCLSDRDGDGRFEGAATGVGETLPRVAELSVVGPTTPLPAPVPYRPVAEDAMPSQVAEFRNCARDHDRPRYSFRARGDGTTPTPESLLAGAENHAELARRVAEARMRGFAGFGTCEVGERVERGEPLYPAAPQAGGAVARLGELVIEVGPRDQGAAVRLLGLRNPDRLYRINGAGVAPLSETVTSKQNQLAIGQRFDRPVLMLAAAPELEEGERAVGDVVLTAPVRHGYMGVLTQDTVIRTLLSRRSLAAGTTLYGIPMSTRTTVTRNGIPMGPFRTSEPTAEDYNLVWCVPLEDEGQWTATCLPSQQGRYTLLRGQRRPSRFAAFPTTPPPAPTTARSRSPSARAISDSRCFIGSGWRR